MRVSADTFYVLILTAVPGTLLQRHDTRDAAVDCLREISLEQNITQHVSCEFDGLGD